MLRVVRPRSEIPEKIERIGVIPGESRVAPIRRKIITEFVKLAQDFEEATSSESPAAALPRNYRGTPEA